MPSVDPACPYNTGNPCQKATYPAVSPGNTGHTRTPPPCTQQYVLHNPLQAQYYSRYRRSRNIPVQRVHPAPPRGRCHHSWYRKQDVLGRYPLRGAHGRFPGFPCRNACSSP
eukprot:sb/3477037/